MIVAVDHWYASSTLWAAAGVVVAVAIGVPTYLAARVPRQRLYYGASPATPLLTARSDGIADLEIRHGGQKLAAPFLLDVVLVAKGRHDIPSSAFDQGRPLVFDLGADIVEVLQTRCAPASSLVPPVSRHGSSLKVGPELISRRQTITISALLDGRPAEVNCTQPVLAQVTVQYRPDIITTNQRRRPTALWVAISAMPLLVAVALDVMRMGMPVTTQPGVAVAVAMVTVVLAVGMVVWAGVAAARRARS